MVASIPSIYTSSLIHSFIYLFIFQYWYVLMQFGFDRNDLSGIKPILKFYARFYMVTVALYFPEF